MKNLIIFIGSEKTLIDFHTNFPDHTIQLYPEIYFHPKEIREYTRKLVEDINNGDKIVLITYSDYIIKEINTCIMLHYNNISIKIKQLYGIEYKTLSMDDVVCYDGIEECSINEYGIEVQSFDVEINEMETIQNEIYYGVDS